MYLKLDHHSGEPIWRQIVEQVKYRIAAGQLQGDEQLPSIRALAAELKINPRTVVKAYEELEHAGLVVMRQGQGVFVTSRRAETPSTTRRRVIADLGRRLFSEALRLGASSDEVIEILKSVSKEMEPKDD
jgi:GntR family transcriptional regulator